jgi:hypothetical protein
VQAVATQLEPEQAKAVAFAVGQAAQVPPHGCWPAPQALATQLEPEQAVSVAPAGQAAQAPSQSR